MAACPQVVLNINELKQLTKASGIKTTAKTTKNQLVGLLEDAGHKLPYGITKKAQDAMQGSINKCLGDLATFSCPPDYDLDPEGEPPRNPSLWAIWNGIRLEPQAREAFERFSGEKVEEIGFMRHKAGSCGASPDGLIVGKSVGIEIKCPIASTHVGYLRQGELPATYASQVHFSMAVTGADAWHFWSYCPGLPPFHFLQKRSDLTERYADGINEFTELLKQAKQEMAELWEVGKNAGEMPPR